jgi:hypothetical protein
VKDSYDEAFWGKFNFIQPEVTLEEAFGKIRNALSENRKKEEREAIED